MSRRPEFCGVPGGLSKRAAQRVIQRAFVLAARDRNVRQHIREACFSSAWSIADWDLEWAVTIRRGQIEFERRLPNRPDIRVTWPTAESFFDDNGTRRASEPFQYEGPAGARRTWEALYLAFRSAFQRLMIEPFDEDGRSLL